MCSAPRPLHKALHTQNLIDQVARHHLETADRFFRFDRVQASPREPRRYIE